MKKEIKPNYIWNKNKTDKVKNFIQDNSKKQTEERKERNEQLSNQFKKEDNDKLIKKIVKDLLLEEARPEALVILSKASEGQLKEFLTYYQEDKGNICCMVLDTIKIKLVESGDMEMKEDDWFGKPMF